MKINIIVALLGLAIPWSLASPVITYDVVEAGAYDVVEAGVVKASAISPRANDEWELVAYSGPEGGSGNGCTGTSETITGNTGALTCAKTQVVKTVACVKATINAGFASCSFQLSRESTGCSSSIPADNTVNVNGTGSSTTANTDDVTFYTVLCAE